MSQKLLFAGNPEPLGGLTNEDELAKACPEEFQRDNPWSKYAMRLFYSGGKIKNWEWKVEDKETKNKQFGCFQGLLGTFGLRHEDKTAVAGWMLSEMLVEVPEYIAGKE
ncbi:MAG: hypothetical protein ABIJ80_03725 [Patescibacteria group bacterium]